MASSQDRPPPTTAAIVIATSIIAGLLGYFLGQGSSLGLFGGSARKAKKESWPNSYDVKVHADSSDEESLSASEDLDNEAVPQEEGGLRDFSNSGEDFKLTLVVRTDLGMTKGKVAAQASHATLACYKALLANPSSSAILRRWENQGQAKVALRVNSEEELETLQAQAVSLGLCAQVVHDAGRTQIASGTATVLGVGPGPRSVVDQVTGGLKLL